MACNNKSGSSVLSLEVLNSGLYSSVNSVVSTEESTMYSTVCTERVSASGGSNVKDPVLNIVAASKNNDDSIEAV